MLDNINSINSRISQIENRIQNGPQINSESFQALMNKAQSENAPAAPATGKPTPEQMMAMRSPYGFNPNNLKPSNVAEVKPLAQNNGVSCGQTSVAMSVNALTGQNLNDADINNKYGFSLLDALNGECKSHGYSWKDAGNIQANSWDLIDYKVNQEKTPVIVALNGPEFSKSGRGHIVTIVKTEGNNVTIADPATGALRTTTKEAMNTAPSHPDGNFVFYATKDDGGAQVANR